ncbi:N-acetylmuramoyl-L-alanine amidase [Hydrogenimonas sp.]
MKALLDQNKSLQVKALLGLIEASKTLGLDPSRYKNALRTIRPDLLKKGETKKAAKKSARTKKSTASIEKHPSSGKRKRKLLASKIENGMLRLDFSAPVARSLVRHFILERKGKILYVFDIKSARTPFSIKRYRGGSFKEVRIAQFDPRRIRIVIETLKPYKPKLTLEGKRVLITLPGAKKRSPKGSSKAKGAAAAAAKEPKPAATPLRRYTVVIDPGHGGKDVGAIGYRGKREKDAVLAVSKRVKKELEKRGFRVYLTRSSDRFIPLKKRTRFANKKQADFFLSIHANAAPKKSRLKSKGLETFFLSPARSGRAKRVAAVENSADVGDLGLYTKNSYLNMMNREKIVESNKLAIDLQKQILAVLKRKYKGVVDNGVREGPFWVLVGAQMPAVLIEIGYISHPVEGPRLFNPAYQKRLAEGIANGIESYILHNWM